MLIRPGDHPKLTQKTCFLKIFRQIVGFRSENPNPSGVKQYRFELARQKMGGPPILGARGPLLSGFFNFFVVFEVPGHHFRVLRLLFIFSRVFTIFYAFSEHFPVCSPEKCVSPS